MMRALIIAMLLFAVSGLSAQAQPPDDFAILQPTFDHVVPVEIAWPIASRTADPDIVSLYAGERVINLWSLTVFVWPEIVGVLLVTIELWWLWRLGRRRGIVGEFHCRKCFYALVGFEGSRCPECGVELTARSRVIAKSRTIPIAICTLLMVAVVGGYFYGRTRLPREGRFRSWNGWQSSRLYQWANDNQHEWLLRYKINNTFFVQIDVRSGNVISTIPTGSAGMVHADYCLDGTHVLEHQIDTLQVFDLGTGERLARLALDPVRDSSLAAQMASIWWLVTSADPDIAYSVTQSGSLQRWNLAERSMERLGIKSHSRIVDMYKLDDGQKLGLLYNDERTGWLIEEFDLETRQVRQTLSSLDRSASRGGLLTTDGQWLAIVEESALIEVQIWNYKTGQFLLNMWAPAGPIRPVAMSADGRWIIAVNSGPTGRPGRYFVFDVAQKRCVGELTWSYPNIRNLCILSDDRTAVAFSSDGQGRIHLFGWDLTRLTAN